MEIRVIESYDSELGYDEEQYYEINNYKNMVVYAQKNKHKQGLEGITLDFDSLIQDLKKKKILIKSEFEDIKESDLKKHYNYFILPHSFINDIVVQLGYEPLSKMRTYKNNEVEYQLKTISDIEFENIIGDSKNPYHWLSKCKFEQAEISLSLTGYFKGVDFKSGTWIDGNWADGNFRNSTWKYGVWEKGTFSNSVWVNGTWEDGDFSGSKWGKGIWEKGTFYSSIWFDGTWEDGKFSESKWGKGIWEKGKFIDSIWFDGTWEDGVWYISNKTRYVNNFQPKNIDYQFDYSTYSFEEIWSSIQLLTKIIGKFLNNSYDTIYIGNHLLTKQNIERRIKEIS